MKNVDVFFNANKLFLVYPTSNKTLDNSLILTVDSPSDLYIVIRDKDWNPKFYPKAEIQFYEWANKHPDVIAYMKTLSQ